MKRYIGLDVHAASSTLAVISQAGKRLQTVVVETNGRAEFCRVCREFEASRVGLPA